MKNRDIKSKDRDSCLRKTRQRAIIHEEILNLKTHPTAEEIYRNVKKKLPNISLGTVYRNLEILSDCGSIRKIELAGSQRRYDGQLHDHYHIHCVYCGLIEDIPPESINVCSKTVQGACDYEILGHEIEFYGLCKNCKPKYSAEN